VTDVSLYSWCKTSVKQLCPDGLALLEAENPVGRSTEKGESYSETRRPIYLVYLQREHSGSFTE